MGDKGSAAELESANIDVLVAVGSFVSFVDVVGEEVEADVQELVVVVSIPKVTVPNTNQSGPFGAVGGQVASRQLLTVCAGKVSMMTSVSTAPGILLSYQKTFKTIMGIRTEDANVWIVVKLLRLGSLSCVSLGGCSPVALEVGLGSSDRVRLFKLVLIPYLVVME